MSEKHPLTRILFVDDEESILNTIKRLFHNNKDYMVFTTSKISEALNIMETNTIQVVVSDLAMPEMNGIDFLRIIKNKYPTVVTILLTGQATLSAAQEAVNSVGIFSLILKPWDHKDLQTRLAKAAQESIKRNTLSSFIDLSAHSRTNIQDLNLNKLQIIFAQWNDEYGPHILYVSPSVVDVGVNEFVNHAFMTLTSIYGQHWHANRTIINIPIEYLKMQSRIYFDYINTAQTLNETKVLILLIVLLPDISKIIETALDKVINPFLNTLAKMPEKVFTSTYTIFTEELFLQIKSTLIDIISTLK